MYLHCFKWEVQRRCGDGMDRPAFVVNLDVVEIHPLHLLPVLAVNGWRNPQQVGASVRVGIGYWAVAVEAVYWR